MSRFNYRMDSLWTLSLLSFLICVSIVLIKSARADYAGTVTVSVPAVYSTGTNKWFDTGVDVTSGGALTIHTEGTWRLGEGPRECNANGLSNFPPYNGHLFGTLMARIGPGGPVFPVGTQYTGTANASGRLYLANNDSLTSDNSGSLQVSIMTRPKVTVSVPAVFSTGTNKWFDTGIDVTSGGALTIHAEGTWRLGEGPRECNANGLPNFPPYNGHLFGTLMARIGPGGPVFPVGTQYTGTANASGRLYLANNDSLTSDNSGELTVMIESR